MILELAHPEDPILRKAATPVLHFDQKLHDFVCDLVETMAHYKGWGLAAPQVCCSERIFAMSVTEEEEMDPLDRLLVFINPELISLSKRMTVTEEGCLSLPDLSVPIERPYKIVVKGQNVRGETFQLTLYGNEARCFLHEYDHLNGVLISDYLTKESYASAHRSK